jgi:hypothetical protein
MNELTPQPVVKPKRQLSDAQREALKKGREKLAEKRRAEQESTQKEEDDCMIDEYDPPETYQSVCIRVAIVLVSYLMMFMVSQHL